MNKLQEAAINFAEAEKNLDSISDKIKKCYEDYQKFIKQFNKQHNPKDSKEFLALSAAEEESIKICEIYNAAKKELENN